jgi:hypothetical protein
MSRGLKYKSSTKASKWESHVEFDFHESKNNPKFQDL